MIHGQEPDPACAVAAGMGDGDGDGTTEVGDALGAATGASTGVGIAAGVGDGLGDATGGAVSTGRDRSVAGKDAGLVACVWGDEAGRVAMGDRGVTAGVGNASPRTASVGTGTGVRVGVGDGVPITSPGMTRGVSCTVGVVWARAPLAGSIAASSNRLARRVSFLWVIVSPKPIAARAPIRNATKRARAATGGTFFRAARAGFDSPPAPSYIRSTPQFRETTRRRAAGRSHGSRDVHDAVSRRSICARLFGVLPRIRFHRKQR